MKSSHALPSSTGASPLIILRSEPSTPVLHYRPLTVRQPQPASSQVLLGHVEPRRVDVFRPELLQLDLLLVRHYLLVLQRRCDSETHLEGRRRWLCSPRPCRFRAALRRRACDAARAGAGVLRRRRNPATDPAPRAARGGRGGGVLGVGAGRGGAARAVGAPVRRSTPNLERRRRAGESTARAEGRGSAGGGARKRACRPSPAPPPPAPLSPPE